jgi:hypothetical protein
MRKKQNLTAQKTQKDSMLRSSRFSPLLPQQMMITTDDIYNIADDNP